MTKTTSKKWIILLSSAVLAVVLAAVLFFLLRPEPPDPHDILANADRLSEQNLCLMYLCKQEPEKEEYLRQLLINYQLLGVDPLTIKATRGNKEIHLPEGVTLQTEKAGEILGGGLVHQGIKITNYPDAGAVATDGETIYLAKRDGIYADYHGLELRISPACAENLTATENGLYFINTTTKRVQYLARDGHRTETLSSVSAKDFAFLDQTLWVVGTDGVLYQGATPMESEESFQEVCALNGQLYAVTEKGLSCMKENQWTSLLPSPIRNLTDGETLLYYINQKGYPTQLNPQTAEETLLIGVYATALDCDNGAVYYVNEAGTLKKID